MKYFIADLHIGHTKLALNTRGFNSVEEHDFHIINSINKRITKCDDLYILGDLTLRKKSELEKLNKLNCKSLYLIKGNHDASINSREQLKYFKDIYGCYKVEYFMLTHIPIHSTEFEVGRRYGYNIHGHSHGRYNLGDRYIDVGVEVLNYTPISLDELKLKYKEVVNE
jgi:calcineurin-like phosphoesterase family protein